MWTSVKPCRAALGLVAERFRRCFSGAAVLATDPNYLFWGFWGGGWGGAEEGVGRGLHSSIFQLNLSRF